MNVGPAAALLEFCPPNYYSRHRFLSDPRLLPCLFSEWFEKSCSLSVSAVKVSKKICSFKFSSSPPRSAGLFPQNRKIYRQVSVLVCFTKLLTSSYTSFWSSAGLKGGLGISELSLTKEPGLELLQVQCDVEIESWHSELSPNPK